MKRSQIVMLTLAGVSLGTTGCRRSSESEPVHLHGSAILRPDALNPALRANLPVFRPGTDMSREIPPHNAYDPQLGYYHEPCAGWFPYPYDHYDSRWGYYRCGRWSRQHSTHMYPATSPYFRAATHALAPGPSITAPAPPMGSSTKPPSSTPMASDYTQQPSGAPVHAGVPHSQATRTLSAFTNRGGFGSTGRATGFFSGS